MPDHPYITDGRITKPRPGQPVTFSVTASGDTTIISGEAGYSTVISYLEYSNGGADLRLVSLKLGDSWGTVYSVYLAPEGGNIARNLTNCEIQTDPGEDVAITLDGAGTIKVTLQYIQRALPST